MVSSPRANKDKRQSKERNVFIWYRSISLGFAIFFKTIITDITEHVNLFFLKIVNIYSTAPF